LTKPNGCTDNTGIPGDGTICDDTAPVGDGFGVCPEGPLDQYCANHPQRSCNADSDCDNVSGACQQRARTCYTASGNIGDTLLAVGSTQPVVADAASPRLAGVFCMGTSPQNAVNNIFGLPGPSRLILDANARFRP
jgi:hypothetical protein